MDEDRKIRFLVAPLLFYTSLLWALWLDPAQHLDWHALTTAQNQQSVTGLIAVLAGGGILVYTSGFLIGTLTYVLLRGCFQLLSYCTRDGSKQHEVALPMETLRNIRLWLKVPVEEQTRREELYVGVTFDHGILRRTCEGVHRWLLRRWTAFAINCTSVTGLALSLVVGWIAGIRLSPWWWFPVMCFILLLGGAAIWAWRDTMGMLSFQASLPMSIAEKEQSPAHVSGGA